MHVYASLQDAKDFLTDEGISWKEGSANDALALGVLSSVSRRVDDACRRSDHGSGFGPRLGVNRYDARGACDLYLADDLIETTSVLLRASTGSSDTSAPVVETDFYLVNERGAYEPGPYRKALFHGQGSVTRFPSGLRVVEWTGKWGHQDVTRVLVPTLDEELDADDTTFDVSGTEGLSPGMTLLIDDEQMYVEAVTSDTQDTITVARAVNGTAATTHANLSPIAAYVYDSRVVDCTLRLWGKRWVARNAGGDGSDGGGEVGAVWPRESEDTIIRRTLGKLRMIGNAVPG